MKSQRRSSSHSSGGARWSLDTIELEQPSLRLIMPGEEDYHENFHDTNNTGISERMSSNGGTQSSRDIEDIANLKTERDAGTTEPRTRSRATSRSILLEWWEEILSIATAVLCTALSGAVLAYMDGRSLSDWGLRLQPSTLIALLATITRAATTYPLAECLGNLKWKFFERPRTLAHLQTFDAATRGPLGAAKYLWALPIHSPLATFVSLLTLFLLLFQPFAQQTMSFASRTAPMANETAQAFQVTQWNMRNTSYQSPSGERFFPSLSYALYQVSSKEDVDKSNNGHCSTSLCEFESFDTLGVCSQCEQREFSGHIGSLFGRCSWEQRADSDAEPTTVVFGMNSSETDEATTKIIIQEIGKRMKREEFMLSAQCGPVAMSFRSYGYNTTQLTNSMGYTDNMLFELCLFDPSDIQRSARWPTVHENDGWRDIENSAMDYRLGGSQDPLQNGGLGACKHTTDTNGYAILNIMNSTCLSLSTDLTLWFDPTALSDQFGILHGTETRCSLDPCVRRMTGSRLQNNEFSTQSIYTNTNRYWRIVKDLDTTEYLLCSGDEEKCPYRWGPGSLSTLGSWINSTIGTRSYLQMYWSQTNSPGNNFTLFHQRMAAQISALLQSRLNPDLVNVTGIAYGTEIYVQVRWMWFILPIVMTISSLFIVMYIIGDSGRKDYLFKNNILAAIAFEMHGWEPHEYGVDETWTLHSMRNVDKKAERMVARMQLPHEGDGGLRLKRE